jgi:hypothetical protein
MKYFVQFLDYSVIKPTELIEACGSDSVCPLDARRNMRSMVEIAKARQSKSIQKYPHFRIMRGNFRSARSVYTTVPGEKLNIYSGYMVT